MATQKLYDVHYPIHHDKPLPYVAGEKIKLTEEEAAPLLHAKVISKPGEEAQTPVAATDYSTLNKQQIVDTAKAELSIDLDMSLTKELLLAKVKEAQTKVTS